MKIDYIETSHKSVEIPKTSILKATIQVIEDKFRISEHWLDKDGDLCVEENTSHSYTRVIGKPTDDQKKHLSSFIISKT